MPRRMRLERFRAIFPWSSGRLALGQFGRQALIAAREGDEGTARSTTGTVRGAGKSAFRSRRVGQFVQTGCRCARTRSTGQSGHQVPPFPATESADRRNPEDDRGRRPGNARTGRGRIARAQGPARGVLERTAGHDHRRRRRQPLALRDGNPRRHRRRRGRAVCPRLVRHVQALLREPRAGRSKCST